MGRLTRGCGHRSVGGIYLVGTGRAVGCGKMPVEIPSTCPTCGCGVRQSRGFSFVNPEMLGASRSSCGLDVCSGCPLGLAMPGKAALLWIGAQHYTPEAFRVEAATMGISRRIAQVPKQLVLNKTWVFLAHPHAIKQSVSPDNCRCKNPQLIDHEEKRPGVVYMFIPKAFEMPLDKKEWLDESGKLLPEKEKEFDRLKARRITPLFVEVDAKGKAIEFAKEPPF